MQGICPVPQFMHKDPAFPHWGRSVYPVFKERHRMLCIGSTDYPDSIAVTFSKYLYFTYPVNDIDIHIPGFTQGVLEYALRRLTKQVHEISCSGGFEG